MLSHFHKLHEITLFASCILICSPLHAILPFLAIYLNIKRYSASHKSCIICSGRTNLRKVSEEERHQALKDGRIFVPVGARICQAHPTTDAFWEEAWNTADLETYTAKMIEDMVDLARTCVESPEIDIPNYTGLSTQQFGVLLSLVPSLIAKTTSAKHAKNALIMFLMRLRKAATLEHIAHTFGVSRFKATKDIDKARCALETDFVPKFLGFANLGRERLLQNTTECARLLHGKNNPDTLITIWDGTYIYCQKSANQAFQKETFSGQKNRNFLRPMVCVTTNGYIIDIFGPFEATSNDAKCMITIFDGFPEVNI